MRNLFPPRSRLETKQKKKKKKTAVGRAGGSGADALFVFDPRLVNYAPLADLATGICNRGCCDDAPASQKISLPGGSDGGARSHPPGHPFSSSAGPLNVFPPQFSLSAPPKRSRGASCPAHRMQVALVTREKGQHPTSTTPGGTARHTAPSHPHGLHQGHLVCPFLAVFKDLTQPPGAQSPAPQSQGVPQTHRRDPQCSQGDPHSTGDKGTQSLSLQSATGAFNNGRLGGTGG